MNLFSHKSELIKEENLSLTQNLLKLSKNNRIDFIKYFMHFIGEKDNEKLALEQEKENLIILIQLFSDCFYFSMKSNEEIEIATKEIEVFLNFIYKLKNEKIRNQISLLFSILLENDKIMKLFVENIELDRFLEENNLIFGLKIFSKLLNRPNKFPMEQAFEALLNNNIKTIVSGFSSKDLLIRSDSKLIFTLFINKNDKTLQKIGFSALFNLFNFNDLISFSEAISCFISIVEENKNRNLAQGLSSDKILSIPNDSETIINYLIKFTEIILFSTTPIHLIQTNPSSDDSSNKSDSFQQQKHFELVKKIEINSWTGVKTLLHHYHGSLNIFPFLIDQFNSSSVDIRKNSIKIIKEIFKIHAGKEEIQEILFEMITGQIKDKINHIPEWNSFFHFQLIDIVKLIKAAGSQYFSEKIISLFFSYVKMQLFENVDGDSAPILIGENKKLFLFFLFEILDILFYFKDTTQPIPLVRTSQLPSNSLYDSRGYLSHSPLHSASLSSSSTELILTEPQIFELFEIIFSFNNALFMENEKEISSKGNEFLFKFLKQYEYSRNFLLQFIFGKFEKNPESCEQFTVLVLRNLKYILNAEKHQVPETQIMIVASVLNWLENSHVHPPVSNQIISLLVSILKILINFHNFFDALKFFKQFLENINPTNQIFIIEFLDIWKILLLRFLQENNKSLVRSSGPNQPASGDAVKDVENYFLTFIHLLGISNLYSLFIFFPFNDPENVPFLTSLQFFLKFLLNQISNNTISVGFIHEKYGLKIYVDILEGSKQYFLEGQKNNSEFEPDTPVVENLICLFQLITKLSKENSEKITESHPDFLSNILFSLQFYNENYPHSFSNFIYYVFYAAESLLRFSPKLIYSLPSSFHVSLVCLDSLSFIDSIYFFFAFIHSIF